VSQSKVPQHENHDISEMCKHFCAKFCSFVYNTTAQKCTDCFVLCLLDTC